MDAELRAGHADYVRRQRQAKKSELEQANEKQVKKLRRITKKDLQLVTDGKHADAVCSWSARVLKVPVGLRAGKPFTIAKWQRDFLSDALSKGVSEAALSVARKNGKTGLIAVLLLSYLVGPLNKSDWRCIVVSLTGQLAAELKKQIQQIVRASEIDALVEVRATPSPGSVRGLNGSEVSILAADKASGHAVGSDLVIIDEAGLLKERDRKLWDACLTSTSGRDGRAIYISIRGDCPMLNEVEQRKKDRSIVWHEYAASRDAEFGDVKQWHRANPGLRLGIKSLEYMKRASKRALASSASAPSFAAYDLNLPQSPLREMIVSVGDYQKCLVPYNKIPSRKGVVCVGIDLGGSSSMTAAVLYWVEVGRLECVGAFGNKVSLKNRGEADGVGDLYNRMCAEGALKLYDGHAPSVSQFVKDLSVDLEGQKIVAIGCDRYRKSEFLDALEGARLSHWQHKLQFRGQGASMNFTADGSADVRAFQSAVVEKKLKLGRSLLLEHAIANSSISRDAAGNPKINRASNKGRIDALQAGVIAVGLGKRWSERKPKTKVRLHVV